MSDSVISDVGKLIVDLLVANERFQFALKYFKTDISDSIYLLYSATVKLINRVITVELRQCRLFRLKYHHILSNESIEEYLYHCLSKILSDVLDQENSYQRFIQPVAELHMKLMSIVSEVQQKHHTVVCNNRKVRHERQKLHNSHSAQKALSSSGTASPPKEGDEAAFQPVYYIPSQQSSARLKKAQYLTFQAINKHYGDCEVDPATVAMLLDFDRSFADFELDFVCQVNKTAIVSAGGAEKTMEVAVLFSEAVRWAHRHGLLQYADIGDCDIGLMVGVPRLAVLYGCGVARHGPLSEAVLLRPPPGDDADDDTVAPVFQGHVRALARLRRQLNVLSGPEVAVLSRLLLAHRGDPPSPPGGGDGGKNTAAPLSGDVHALFKMVAAVADQMQSEHASDYRFFMEVVYKLYKDEDDDEEPEQEGEDGGRSWLPRCLSSPQLAAGKGGGVEEAVDALAFCRDQSPRPTKTLPLLRLDHKADAAAALLIASSPVLPAPPAPGAGAAPTTLTHRPQWQHDSNCLRCCHCGLTFTLFRRRHHCRRCGYLFCRSCWGDRVPLPTLGIRTLVPVCVECRDFLLGDGAPGTNSSRVSAPS